MSCASSCNRLVLLKEIAAAFLAQDLHYIRRMSTDNGATKTDQALSQDNKLREFDPTQPYMNQITICDTREDLFAVVEAKDIIMELVRQEIPKDYQNDLIFSKSVQEGRTILSWNYTPKDGN